MANPAQAPPPSQAPSSSGEPPRVRRRPLSIWRTLAPLLLLVIPLGIKLFAHYAPEPWSYWLVVAAGWLTAGIVIWVLVRLFFYGRERWRLHQQRSFHKRQDPLFVAGNKLDARIREVHNRLKSASLGIYGLNWYLVMGDSSQEVETILAGSGLTSPPELDSGLNITDDQLDHWHFTNEAIFIDTSASPMDRDDKEWELLASRLAAHRPKESISGVILVLDVDHLSQDDQQSAERRRKGILSRLRSLQSRLQLTFPVYVVVSGINRIPGFLEFFADLDQNQKKQILGWSTPLSSKIELDQNRFRQGLQDLSSSLESLMLDRLSGAMTTETADRIYVFNEEIKSLWEALRKEVEAVFAPNLFLDPIPFRGLYLASGSSEGNLVSFRPEGPLVSGALPYEDMIRAKSWFTGDLFSKKILAEWGLSRRPRHVRRKDWLIKGATALAAVAALSLGGWWIVRSVHQYTVIVENLKPTLEAADSALTGQTVLDDPMKLCDTILQHKRIVVGGALWERMIRSERFSALLNELGQLHRACFQDLFLRDYMSKVEDTLLYWKGDGDFQVFVNALAEYIRWAKYRNFKGAKLSIAPFTELVGNSRSTPENIIAQFKAMKSEGGLTSSLVSNNSEQIIQHALRELTQYLKPSISQTAASGNLQEQSQWWQDFTQLIVEMDRHYQTLVNIASPGKDASYQEVLAKHDALVNALSNFLGTVDALGSRINTVASQDNNWIDLSSAVKRLRNAASGWDSLSGQVQNFAGAASTYRRDVDDVLKENLYLVQMLGNMPGYPWLRDQLAKAYPKRASILENPQYQVGYILIDLFTALEDYQSAIENWQLDYDSWERRAATYESIASQAQTLNSKERRMLRALNKVQEVRKDIKAMSGGNQGRGAAATTSSSSLIGIVEKNLGKGTSQKSKQQQAAAMRSNLLGLMKWPGVDKSLPGWLKVMNRIRLYQTSLYWQDLEAKFSFGNNLLKSQSWKQIKRETAFSTNEQGALVYPVVDFLNQWVQSVPSDFMQFTQPGGKNPAPRELTGFLRLNKSVTQFQQKWLEPLRKATQQFVTCVHDMDLDPARAWAQIWQTEGVGASGQRTVTWGALKALSGFRDSFEAANGPVMENITGTLVDVENNVTNAFQQAVIASFDGQWEKLISKYQKLDFDGSFPFSSHAKTAVSRDDLNQFYSDLDTLSAAFDLIPSKKSSAGGTALDKNASDVFLQMRQAGRLSFVKECAQFKQFLSGQGRKQPLQVTVKLIPGEIGRHMHWLRIQVAPNQYYDLNVYGEPVAAIPVESASSLVAFQALDLSKNPTVSTTVAKGDYALLMLPYVWGATKDPKRKVWMVDGTVPSVASPGQVIPFQIQMTFNAGLPELPQWPKR